MPEYRIPQMQRRVSIAPLPGVRQDIRTTQGEFGGAEAQAIYDIGGILKDVSTEFERRDVEKTKYQLKLDVERKKAELELQERKDKMNAQAGALEFTDAWRVEKNKFKSNMRLEADGITQKAIEWYNKTENSLMSKTKTNRERDILKSLLGPERTKLLDNISKHEFEQLRLAEVELNDSIYANAVMDAGAPDSTDIDRVDAELKAINALNIKYKDYDSETRLKGVAEGMSAFHESIIEGKLVVDLPFAKKYFKENKKAILTKEREALRKQIRKETIKQTAQNIAISIPLKEEDTTKWRERIDQETDDEEIKKAAWLILEAKKKDQESHDAEIKQREYTDGLNAVMNADNLEDARAKADLITDPEDRLKALKVADSLYEKKKKEVETDRNVQAQVYDKIDTGQINTVEQLIEYSPYLSTADYNRLVTELRNKQGKAEKVGFVKYETAKRAYEIVKNKKRDIENKEQNKEFMYLQSNLDKHAQSLGRDLTPDEAIKLTAKYIVEGESIGMGIFGLTDPDMSRFEATREGTLDVWAPDIEDAERPQIKQSLKNLLGITTDDETIMRLYKKNAILDIPLSDKQKDILNKAVDKERRKFELLRINR